MLEAWISRITREDIRELPDSAALSEDLHLDSLGRVELQSVLEAELGVQIDATAYQHAHSVGDLRKLLVEFATESGDQHAYPVWPWAGVPRALRILFIEAVMRPLVGFLGKPKIRRDFDARLSGPVLIVANHVTAYDAPLILYALRAGVRHRVAIAMAGEMLLDLRNARGQGNSLLNMTGPFQYVFATGVFNVFPLPQTGDFRKSFAHAGRAMDAGYHVLVFPEGRRTPDGRMHSFQGGAGLLWNQLRTPALPVYLDVGDGRAGNRKWFRSGRLTIRIGRPIPFSADRDAAEATRVLERAVRQLADASQPGPSEF
jgi:long-chain acyl-CoA synthetase